MGTLGDRLSQTGSLVAGGGITLGVGWGIWAAQSPNAQLWEWPMLLAIAVGLLGGAMTVWSFFGTNDSSPNGLLKQRQSGGAGSVNIQAGRDVTYKKTDGRS